MARQDAPTGILIVRLVVPFAAVAVYWAVRLHDLLNSGGSAAALVELVFAVIVTLVALGFMADALVRIYHRIVGS